jgi:hypothetical protein
MPHNIGIFQIIPAILCKLQSLRFVYGIVTDLVTSFLAATEAANRIN